MDVSQISPQNLLEKPLTEEAFLALGVHSLAYLRRANVNGRQVWAAHAADGTPLSVFAGEDSILARATLRQNDLIPVSVH